MRSNFLFKLCIVKQFANDEKLLLI